MKNKEHIYFYRWGNLNPVKHREARLHDSEKSFHTAPVVNGIYAFPRGYIERFLIGGSFTNHCERFLYEDNGDKIPENNFWQVIPNVHISPKYKKLIKKRHIKEKDLSSKYDEETGTFYVTYKIRPHRFEHKGELWHHLKDCVKSEDILDETEHWVKTTYDVYCKALKQSDTKERFNAYINPMFNGEGKSRHGNPHNCPNCFSKDHYEVFIEKVKNVKI